MIRSFLVLIVAALAAVAAQAQTLQLRLLHTTDLHMHLLAWDYYQDKPTEEYGLARTATLIKVARAQARNTMLFDNGDLLQGSPLGEFVARVQPLARGQVHPAHRVMRHLRYDAANLGNHEFNFGLPFLRRALATAPFPVVSANVMIDDGDGNPVNDKPAFRPYVLLDRSFVDDRGRPQRLKVGVIGFLPPQIMLWDRSNLLGRVTVRDIPETARRLVPEMKAKGADVIVAIPHSGFELGETVWFAENAVARLAEVEGVDAILFGHSHGEFPGRFFNAHPKVDLAKGTINGVPAVMPGRWGDHLGVVDLTLERRQGRWQRVDGRGEIRPIWDRRTRKALVEPDPDVARLVAAEHEGTLRYMRAVVAETTEPIHSYFALVADDPSVQIVSQAQMAYAKKALAATPHAGLPVLSAAAPFKTGGRQGFHYYTDIPAGPVALRSVADLYIYPNVLKAVKRTGAQVREWLEMSAGAFRRIDPQGPAEQMLLDEEFRGYNFDTIDGLTYQIDVTQPSRYDRDGKLVRPEARRIVDLRFAGQPIDDAAEFVVVTNNYRANGGGNFPGLDGTGVVLDAPDENRDAVVQFMRSEKTVNPRADGNWRIAPVPGVKLRFVSGAAGAAHLPRYPSIRLVKDNGDGSALYELTP